MSATSTGRYDALVDATYAAGLDAGKWQEFCDMLGRQLGEEVCWAVLGYDHHAEHHLGALSANYAPDFIESFERYYCSINPWTRGLAGLSPGRIVTADQLLPDRELVKTEFYNGWVRPQDDLATGAGVVVVNDDRRSMMITCNVRRVDKDRHLGTVVRLLGDITPHVRRAFNMLRTLHNTRFADTHYLRQIEAIPNAVFLLDKRGRPSFCNQAAEKLLATRSAFTTDVGGVMQCADRDAAALLSDGLQAIATRQFHRLSDGFVVRRRDGSALAATLLPLQIDTVATGFITDFVSQNRPVAILTITDPAARPSLHREAFARVYDLTRAEANLAEAIAQGASLSAIARYHHVSVNTVRTQLKAIFAKTGTGRQGELVALLSRFTTFQF